MTSANLLPCASRHTLPPRSDVLPSNWGLKRKSLHSSTVSANTIGARRVMPPGGAGGVGREQREHERKRDGRSEGSHVRSSGPGRAGKWTKCWTATLAQRLDEVFKASKHDAE